MSVGKWNGKTVEVKGGPKHEAGVITLSHKVLKGNDFSLCPASSIVSDRQP